MAPRSFREIQVSTSQLALIFLALLAIAVVIFLLGVSVGKKSTETSQPETSREKIAAALPKAAETEIAPALIAEKKEETKLGTEKTTSAGETSKEPTRREKTEPSTKPPEPVSQKSDSATVSKPAQTSLKPSPKSEAQKKSPPAAGNYFVQAGAFSKREATTNLVQNLTRLGYQTQVLAPFPTDKNPVYRVRVGPFSTLQEAEKARDHIRTSVKEAAKAFIVRT